MKVIVNHGIIVFAGLCVVCDGIKCQKWDNGRHDGDQNCGDVTVFPHRKGDCYTIECDNSQLSNNIQVVKYYLLHVNEYRRYWRLRGVCPGWRRSMRTTQERISMSKCPMQILHRRQVLLITDFPSN